MMIFPSAWNSASTQGTFNTNYTCRGANNPSILCPLINGNINVSNILTTSTTSSFSYNITDIRNPGS